MTWTNEALTPYVKAHAARAEGRDYRIGSAPVAGWQAGFLELATELLELRAQLAPRPVDLRGLETIWQPKLHCPSCAHRLEPMEAAPPGTTGVCPSCGEFVRSFALAVEAPERGAPCPACSTPVRTYLVVRVYTDEEADANAHPEVLAKLRGIQSTIRAAAICGCDNTPALARREGRDRTCLYSDEQLRADVGAGPCSGAVAVRDSWPDGDGGEGPVYGCEGHAEFMREQIG